MNNLFKTVMAICLILTAFQMQAQAPAQTLPVFDKVIVSPLVSVVLVAGEQESVRFVYQHIDSTKVNYSVQHKTLRIYLNDARITVKQQWGDDAHTHKRAIYPKGTRVTAYVTYRQLNELQIRGEEEITCQDALISDAFRLRVYGQATVTLASLKTAALKASFYGENKVTIQSGRAVSQRYRSYGENKIDTENLTGETVSAHTYGDSQLRVYASGRIGVTAFGESDIRYAGGGHLHKGLVIGDVTIHKAD